MDIKNDTKDIKETAAADTLKPGSMDGTKSSMMAKLMSAVAGMSIEDMTKFTTDSLAQIGHEADSIPDGASAKNRATIAAKGSVKEDIDLALGDELDESMKEKISTIFEAAVDSRLQLEVVELTEALEVQMNEQVAHELGNLAEAVDKFVVHAAESWLQENEVAINNTLKIEIMEEFINDMKEVFAKNFVTVPDEKADLVDSLVARSQELEDKVNKLLKDNIELQAALEMHDAETMVEEVSTGLTDTQKEKFRTLVENMTFKSTDDHKKKLLMIKEAYFSGKKTTSGILNENAGVKDPKEIAEENTVNNGEDDEIVQRISDFISKK